MKRKHSTKLVELEDKEEEKKQKLKKDPPNIQHNSISCKAVCLYIVFKNENTIK